MRRKDREVTNPERIDEIIRSASVLHLGLFDEEGVYIVPVNFGFEHIGEERIFYFHSAKQGRKVNALESGGEVTFELESVGDVSINKLACSGTQYYSSVMGKGSVRGLTEAKEKQRALEMLLFQTLGRADYPFSEESLKATAVYALTVESISAKEHA